MVDIILTCNTVSQENYVRKIALKKVISYGEKISNNKDLNIYLHI